MIQISREELPEATTRQLHEHTRQVAAKPEPERATEARRRWRTNYNFRTYVYPVLRTTLDAMAPGIGRCMYCGENEGTAVDHFEPVASAPLRTFVWLNHLLACARCNSDYKREHYPQAPDRTPLLIDPTSQDPAEHLHLILAVGEYRGLTAMGRTTIDVLGLNRGTLVQGRRDVFQRTGLILAGLKLMIESDRPIDLAQARRLVWDQPLADVVDAMLRQAQAAGAADIFVDDLATLDLLRDPLLRGILA